MKISIDCRMLGMSGIGNYLKGCLLILINTNNNFVLIGDEKKIIPIVKEYSNYNIINYKVKPFSIIDTFLINKEILKSINNCDIYYSPFFNIPCGIKIPVFLTIHDILFMDMPNIVSFFGLHIRIYFYKRAIIKANLIFTVSEFSKSRIIHHLGNNKCIINASNAIIHDNYSITKNKKKYILFIGNIKEHKGLKILMEAYCNAILEDLEYKLIIMGEKNNFRSFDKNTAKFLNKLNSNDIIFTGNINDSEKLNYLSEASLLVQPSLYEGFGYPPLEAMYCGTNVLISDIPVFKEIYKDYPVTYFKSGDSYDLKNKLFNLLHNKKSTVLNLSKNLKEKYNFNKTVSIILNEMENLNIK